MRLVPHVLLRAPLRPIAALDAPIDADPLGAAALRLASPSLARHGDVHAAAKRRYARRAAFRPTPSGLLAGVAVGQIVDGPTRIALEAPEVKLDLGFARLAAIARAALDTEAGFAVARLRVAPSLLRDRARLSWLAFGDGAMARRVEVELDPLLERVLDACADWTPATRVLARLSSGRAAPIPDAAEARGFLLALVDDGLLHHDLEPPLVGPPPLAWARTRLAAADVDLDGIAAVLEDEIRPIGARLDEAEARLDSLPGEAGLRGTLVHRGRIEIARAPLERAAQLAPTLFALAEALTPPLAEAELVPGLDEALAAASALVGEGALPLPALGLGLYGAPVDGTLQTLSPDRGLVAWLSAQVVAAARAGREAIALDVEALRAHLPSLVTPSSFELQIQPCVGEGWLLGVHAPAGASWGRFAHALGAPMDEALAALREAERAVDGAALRVDVAYAPSREVADLCATPSLREAALAISSWPEAGAIVPAQCAIVDEPAGPAHRAVRVEDRALVVAPLHRVRSTTAPPSVERALLGDTLLRQHAPWALAWGPLAALPWLPRVTLEGFVIAPQSWALPAHLDEAALRAWRTDSRAPRWIMVGLEDQLLPIDLDDADDRAALIAMPVEERARALEIWPPLGRELDTGGRRVELICAVTDEDAGAEIRHARAAAVAIAAPPAEAPPARGWRTVKLYAPRDRHARLLADWIAPFLAQARPRGWFFLPYVEDGRAQLRLRLHARDAASMAAALATQLEPAIAEGELVSVEIGAYQPERARYGEALALVERVFESDSRLAVEALFEEDGALPPEVSLVCAFDALARGLGLPSATIERRAVEALVAYAVDEREAREHLAPAYRALQRPLLALLDAPSALLRAHTTRLRALRFPRRAAEALLPTLLHLAAVRRRGADREAEVRALYLWTRALESRRARGSRPRARARR